MGVKIPIDTKGYAVASVEQLQNEITRLKRDEADQRKNLSVAQREAAKARAAARDKQGRSTRISSASMTRSHLREAERLEKKAIDQDKKAVHAARKLADNSAKQVIKIKSLEAATRAAQRRGGREDELRRQLQKRHAQEIERLSQLTRNVREVRVIDPPKHERLRVLYLAANPEMDLRVDVEVRKVREAVRKTLHRDLVEIDDRPAATPNDLLDGINDVRPHIVHFSGHGGGASVLFDDSRITRDGEESVGHVVSFELLAMALRATDKPPKLLILNACDTLNGAKVLLDVTPVVIAMAVSVSDSAAALFAERFYAAIASAQSVAAALGQGAFAVGAAGLDEGWKPEALTRDGVDLTTLVLVQPPASR